MKRIRVVVALPGETAVFYEYVDFESILTKVLGPERNYQPTTIPGLKRKSVSYRIFTNPEFSKKKQQPNRIDFFFKGTPHLVYYGPLVLVKYFREKPTTIDEDEVSFINRDLNSLQRDPWYDIRIAMEKHDEEQRAMDIIRKSIDRRMNLE